MGEAASSQGKGPVGMTAEEVEKKLQEERAETGNQLDNLRTQMQVCRDAKTCVF
jgi:hypothetical protein